MATSDITQLEALMKSADELRELTARVQRQVTALVTREPDEDLRPCGLPAYVEFRGQLHAITPQHMRELLEELYHLKGEH